MRRCQERRALARSIPLGLCLIARKLVSSQARSSFELVALLNSSSLPRRDTRSVHREEWASWERRGLLYRQRRPTSHMTRRTGLVRARD